MAAAQPNPARTSFVIASRNRAAELAATITRLLDTTNCPIILVDNHSEDCSVGTARRIEAAFVAAGGFSDILHFRGEEQLLAVDLATLGWELCYCPELVAVHQPSAQRPSTAAQDARSLRNAVLTTWMRRPIRHCVKATGSLIWAALHDGEHARGAAQALVRLPAVVGQRRRLPPHVEQALALLESG
jgi:hypothetical protein